MAGHAKVMIKVHDGKEFVWRHFCYVPSALLNQYRKSGIALSENIVKWAEVDTGVKITDLRSLRLAKSKIKTMYKHKYPDLYLENDIDRQGWNRLWLIEHIKEELSNE